MDIAISIAVTVILTIINGYFSMSEMALSTAKKVVLENLSDTINDAMEGRLFLDYKSRLLEIAQKKNNQHKITFEIVGESGPAHMREFETEIRADRVFLARAKGHSKKDSEQKCAKEAIEKYKEIFGA
jgi:ribonuclease-3